MKKGAPGIPIFMDSWGALTSFGGGRQTAAGCLPVP